MGHLGLGYFGLFSEQCILVHCMPFQCLILIYLDESFDGGIRLSELRVLRRALLGKSEVMAVIYARWKIIPEFLPFSSEENECL